MPLSLITFDPPSAIVDQVINDLCDPDELMGDIAAQYGTTIEALAIWMSRPDISERIAAVESVFARRVRLVALNALPTAAHALHHVCRQYLGEEAKIPARPNDLRAHEFHRRARETTRRAASLLLRLARFSPSPGGTGVPPVFPVERAFQPVFPSTASAPPPPNPFGGGGRVFEAGGGAPGFRDPDPQSSAASLPGDAHPLSAAPLPTFPTPEQLLVLLSITGEATHHDSAAQPRLNGAPSESPTPRENDGPPSDYQLGELDPHAPLVPGAEGAHAHRNGSPHEHWP